MFLVNKDSFAFLFLLSGVVRRISRRCKYIELTAFLSFVVDSVYESLYVWIGIVCEYPAVHAGHYEETEVGTWK